MAEARLHWVWREDGRDRFAIAVPGGNLLVTGEGLSPEEVKGHLDYMMRAVERLRAEALDIPAPGIDDSGDVEVTITVRRKGKRR